MLLAFVDETSDSKFKDYLGFCISTVNAKFYPSLKYEAQKILLEAGWDPSVEFKGSYLFSASQGCTSVKIETRICAAEQLIDLHIAESNQRMKFHYGVMQSNDHRRDYLKSLPSLLAKALPKAPKRAGKNLLCLVCDRRDDISPDELQMALEPAVNSREYILFERVALAKSSFDTIGLMYADLVGYLAGRIDTIANDSELIEGLTPEQIDRNGKIRKLRSSVNLMSKIKKLKLYAHVEPET